MTQVRAGFPGKWPRRLRGPKAGSNNLNGFWRVFAKTAIAALTPNSQRSYANRCDANESAKNSQSIRKRNQQRFLYIRIRRDALRLYTLNVKRAHVQYCSRRGGEAVVGKKIPRLVRAVLFDSSCPH